ncbi:MAG: helix-turn-helix domain-containing protein [Tannerellaceae bacterium]
MKDIRKYNNIDDYHKEMGIETLHPLVSIIDFSKVQYNKEYPDGHCFGFYAVFLKDVHCGDMKYGKNYYDYQEGTLVFLAPNQIVTIENRKSHQPKGLALLFHPDFLRGTTLGQSMKDYTFFSYEVSEALHISEQERATILDCFRNIETELHHNIDNHSKKLIASNIELFLNYCSRYYDRQFITRNHVNSDILSRFEALLNDYSRSDAYQTKGLPTVKFCAEKLNLSANYLGDLLKKETGKSAKEHIQLSLIELAKERLYDTNRSISEIAYELGFEYPQYFSRLFKKRTGMTPNEYRSS